MSKNNSDYSKTLRDSLVYEPKELGFGTSGRRGLVADLSQLEIYINVLGELRYLQSLPASLGGISRGDEFYFAQDLRPSSTSFVPELQGRGEIAQAVQRAIQDAGMRPVNLGPIPSPALAHYGFQAVRGSIMVTGSHIPFDRNGYKLNRSNGELLKEHENPINREVRKVRDDIYSESFANSLFDERGQFKSGPARLADCTDAAAKAFVQRYREFFRDSTLRGRRIVVYQHSAVGRDLLVEVLQLLGAEAIPVGRSDSFVPIDTENIDEAQRKRVQDLTAEFIDGPGVDAVVSTDGDSDRPLLLTPNASGELVFWAGDLLGIVAAECLRADSVTVPVSCSDALERGSLARAAAPRTRIGSPFVIAGMEKARQKGARIVCGWEANGGFLTGTDILRNGRSLSALPTRDAFLPLLCVLFSAQEQGLKISGLFEKLPGRFSRAGLLKNFSRSVSAGIVESFSPGDPSILEAAFEQAPPAIRLLDGSEKASGPDLSARLTRIRSRLQSHFSADSGFDPIVKINYLDGIRIWFRNGDIAHIRPSGNADELRIYAVADSRLRADEIVKAGISEPGGILRRMEKEVGR